MDRHGTLSNGRGADGQYVWSMPRLRRCTAQSAQTRNMSRRPRVSSGCSALHAGQTVDAPAKPARLAPSKMRSTPIAIPMKYVLAAVQVAKRYTPRATDTRPADYRPSPPWKLNNTGSGSAEQPSHDKECGKQRGDGCCACVRVTNQKISSYPRIIAFSRYRKNPCHVKA